MDYSEIIENLTIEHVEEILRQLDIDYEDRGDYFVMPTYCHNHKSNDASKKLYFYKNNKLFVCYTQCGNMSIFKFLQHYYEAQEIEYDWYRDIYEVIVGSGSVDKFVAPAPAKIERYNKPTELPRLPSFDENVLNCFTNYHPVEWLRDGIGGEQMDSFNIKYDQVRNKIIIPHYDIEGRLVGIRGRALNEEDVERYGKYMPICVEGKWYSHPLSLNCYGLNKTIDEIRKYKRVFIAESEKSVMQHMAFDIPHCCVAVCGSNFNKYILLLLLKACPDIQEITLCFDRENDAGDTEYYNKLRNICDTYKQYTQFSFIYDFRDVLRLKESPFDRGETAFRELYKYRIKL